MYMAEKKRILIVEDRTIVREGLRLLVTSDERYTIAGEAEDGHAAIKAARELQPDLILMDLSMPKMNGMDAVREIKKLCMSTRILVLTVHDTDEFILASLEAGADGYVLKDANKAELMLAIENVLEGKAFLSPGISEKIISGYLSKKKPQKPKSSVQMLTHREREILKLIAEGYKNKSIAELLCISANTVEKHRENIMHKLGLHNASGLTSFAIDNGLIMKV
jgi:DNA-binding NarL/FixJ family response regulator